MINSTSPEAAVSREANKHVSVKQWPTQAAYFVRQFFGTQVEVYIMTFAFFWIRPMTAAPGYGGALEVGALCAAATTRAADGAVAAAGMACTTGATSVGQAARTSRSQPS